LTLGPGNGHLASQRRDADYLRQKIAGIKHPGFPLQGHADLEGTWPGIGPFAPGRRLPGPTDFAVNGHKGGASGIAFVVPFYASPPLAGGHNNEPIDTTIEGGSNEQV
jgi:hypothetical protein